MLTKGALGNLINRYRAVLKKCHLMNVFGSLAVAGMLVMNGVPAAASIVNNGQIDEGNSVITADTKVESQPRYAAVIVTAQDVEIQSGANAEATVKINDSNAERVYGFYTASGSSLTLTATDNFSCTVDTTATQVSSTRMFRAYGKMTLNGNITAVAKGKSEVVGAEAWEGANITFTGGLTNLVASSSGGSGRVIGIQNPVGNTMFFKADQTTIVAQNDSSLPTQGLYATQSSTYFSGDTTIKVQGGSSPTYGIDVECDPGDMFTTTVELAGQQTLIEVSAPDAVFAVRPSGVPGTINFTGKTATIRATSSSSDAFGIDSQYGAHLNASADVAVEVSGATDALGLALLEYGYDDDYYAGNANFTGTLRITATAETGTAYGIINSSIDAAPQNTDDGNLTVTGTTDVTAKSNSGDAYGIYGIGNIVQNTLTGDVRVNVFAPSGNSYGVYADEDAVVSLGSDGTSTSITATGNSSTAITITNTASVAFAGTTVLSADKALVGDGGVTNSGNITVASGTVDSFTGTYTQTSGSTTLADDSKFFGGDVTIAKGSLTVGNVDTSAVSGADSMLALGRSITVAEGQNLRIGTTNGEGVVFGAGSALVVDGTVAANKAMIQGSGSLTVENGAQLYIANAKANTAYTITDGLEGDTYWTEANLLASRLIKATVSQNGDAVIVSTEVQDLASVLPGVIPVSALTTMVAQNLNDTESDFMGVRFLSRATEPQYMSDDAKAVSVINEASQAAVTAGVQHSSLRVIDAASEAVLRHLSLFNFDHTNTIHNGGIDMWITPMYGSTYTSGMAAEDADVQGDYMGIVVGADTHVAEIGGGELRVGAAFNLGRGHSETDGTATDTENDYTFGGANLYAGWTLDNFNLLASVGYHMAYHDIDMGLPASLSMGNAETDVETRAISADLRAEYRIDTGIVDLLPHVGVRYTSLYTGGYELRVHGKELNSVEEDTFDYVQFPIGVGFIKDFGCGDWNIKAQADVSFIPVAGETDAESEVRWTGINATDSVAERVVDGNSFAGTVGVMAETGNLAFGLNYGLQAAAHETDHKVQLNLVWKF